MALFSVIHPASKTLGAAIEAIDDDKAHRAVFLAALLTLTPVASPATTAADTTPAPAASSAITVMPLGASMTNGKGSSTGNGYREELRQRLRSFCSPIRNRG
ncbi:hypothetical protein AB0J83_17430 [Actinoplanes sp. NPDC049596]|uniref:hypothetical protein n=1 Tax=unclassified Actinoplanes TaxID=2626549 RepID=UPI003416C94E